MITSNCNVNTCKYFITHICKYMRLPVVRNVYNVALVVRKIIRKS